MAYKYRGNKPWKSGVDEVMARAERPLQPCGTPAAARRHRKYGEPPCDECRNAESASARARYAAKKAAANV